MNFRSLFTLIKEFYSIHLSEKKLTMYVGIQCIEDTLGLHIVNAIPQAQV